MSTTPDYAILVKMLPTLRVFPDALGWTTLTAEEADKIRLLGFSAEAGRWKVSALPPELTFDTPFESLSVGWYTPRSCFQLVHTRAHSQYREIQFGLPLEAEVKADVSAITSDSNLKPVGREQEQCPPADAGKPEIAARILRARHDQSRARRLFMEKLWRLPAAGTGQALPVFPDSAWERLRYKGKKLRRWLEDNRASRPCPFFQQFQDLTWTRFKRFNAAESDLLPWLIWLFEPQHPGIFERRRPRRPKSSDPFEDMPEPFQSKARIIFARLCERWKGNLPSWRKAILVGSARRLATHPPGSQWGRRMLAKRGGLAVQEKYRQQGHHPLGLVVPNRTKP
jgi:hypothetical protein